MSEAVVNKSRLLSCSGHKSLCARVRLRQAAQTGACTHPSRNLCQSQVSYFCHSIRSKKNIAQFQIAVYYWIVLFGAKQPVRLRYSLIMRIASGTRICSFSFLTVLVFAPGCHLRHIPSPNNGCLPHPHNHRPG